MNSKEIRIVLIHLGSYPPEYFWCNLSNLLENHKNIGIDLIFSTEIKHEIFVNRRIRVFSYKASPDVTEVLENQNIDSKFRDGFWRFSTERLFALVQHANENPHYSYLHVESDVLILPGFPFEEFRSFGRLSWSRYDSDRDLASLVFIPNSKESQWLLRSMHTIISESSGLNDMLLLNRIAMRNPNRIGLLPTSPNPKSMLLCEEYTNNESEKIATSKNFHIFEGIFDSAALGIWLTGMDPRNYFGVRRRFSSLELLRTPTYIDPSQGQYRYTKREGLFVRCGESEVRVFNLHIHSKDISLFGPSWESELQKMVNQSRKNKVFYDFSIKIFLDLIIENRKKGSLLGFVFWLPGIRLARRLGFIKKSKFLR